MDKKLTLSDIEQIPKEFLIASDIAPYLKSDAATIIYCAKNNPDLLGFPVIVTGKMVRIPKQAFIFFCKFGKPAIDYNLLSYAVSCLNQEKGLA